MSSNKKDEKDKNASTKTDDKEGKNDKNDDSSTVIKEEEPDDKKTEEEEEDEDDDFLKVRFNLYTPDSWEASKEKEEALKKKLEKSDGKAEAHLVDGQLKFDDDEEEARKTRDPRLVEGNALPEELAIIFRKDYRGKPLEEIDRFMKEKVI